MKTISIFAALCLMFVFQSCVDSTLDNNNPVDSNNKKQLSEFLVKCKWIDTVNVTKRNENAKYQQTGYYDWQQFYSDGVLIRCIQYQLKMGTWSLNSAGTELTIQLDGQSENEIYDISYISGDPKSDDINNKIRVFLTWKKNSKAPINNKITYRPEYSWYRSGVIRTSIDDAMFTKLPITSSCRMYVIFDIQETTNKYSYVYEISSSIKQNSSPNAMIITDHEIPLVMLNNLGNNEYVGIGRVILTSDPIQTGRVEYHYVPDNYLGGLDEYVALYRRSYMKQYDYFLDINIGFDLELHKLINNPLTGYDEIEQNPTYGDPLMNIPGSRPLEFRFPNINLK